MAIAKQTKRAKRKTPNKKAHKDRAVYSLARKKKGKPDFQYANGEHSNGKNGSLHEDPIPYRTQFTAVLDVAPPPTLEICQTCCVSVGEDKLGNRIQHD